MSEGKPASDTPSWWDDPLRATPSIVEGTILDMSITMQSVVRFRDQQHMGLCPCAGPPDADNVLTDATNAELGKIPN